MDGKASNLEIGVMVIYLVFAIVLFVIEVKVYKRAFPQKKMKKKESKGWRIFWSIVMELAIIFGAIQLNDFVPKKGFWPLFALVALILAFFYKLYFLEK